jgi:hypothetical protein
MGQLLFQMLIGLIFLLFLLVGIAAILQSYIGLSAAISSRKWNSVEAVVTDHEVYAYKAGGDKTPRTAYGYSVTYSYSVEHQTYQGSGFDHGNFLAWEYAEHALARNYPVGKAVKILYSPKDQEISSSRDPSEWITSEVTGLLFGVGGMLPLTGIIIAFLDSADAAGSVIIPIVVIGTSILLILFWCLILFNIARILIICFKEIKDCRLPRPLDAFFILFLLFGLLSIILMIWLNFISIILMGWLNSV